MKRRTYLAVVGSSVTALAGCTATNPLQTQPRPDYYGEQEIVYDHPSMTLTLLEEEVHLGDRITFRINNTGETTISLGCSNPWALQRQHDGDWTHITWTAAKYYQLCLTTLTPTETINHELVFSKSGLEKYATELAQPLRPGTYRFILLGPTPFVATQFRVHS